MARIEILVEEASMKEVLEVVLPKLLPERWILNQNYFIRPHSGKTDLRKSIPKKIKVFSHYHEPVGVVILHDQDSADCKMLKNDLVKLCQANGNCPALIRIICRELESWYLGDLEAVEKAYPQHKVTRATKIAKYRTPDDLTNASEEMKKLVPEFQKVSSAKAIAPYLNTASSGNTSVSFEQFVSGIQSFFDRF